MEKQVYTVVETAKALQVCDKTVRTWVREGKLKAVRFSRNVIRVPVTEINRLLGK